MSIVHSLIALSMLSMAPAGDASSLDEALAAAEEQQSIFAQEWLNSALSPHPQITFQVRIERRIRIRIPRLTPANRQRMSSLQARPVRKYKAKKIGKCVPMNGIAGVRVAASENRLLLYMRDRRIIRADLERACLARSFYSGFYLEQSKDGQLCVERDLLLARSGTKCEIDKMRQLVPDD